MRHLCAFFFYESFSHWYFKLQEKMRVPNQHLAVAQKLKASVKKLWSLLLVALSKREDVQNYLIQVKKNQLKSKQRAALKRMMDENDDHLRRLKIIFDRNFSNRQENAATEIGPTQEVVSEAKVSHMMKEVLSKAVAIVLAKEDVILANKLHKQIFRAAKKVSINLILYFYLNPLIKSIL
jgi:formyltetrahydrofolate synthetase